MGCPAPTILAYRYATRSGKSLPIQNLHERYESPFVADARVICELQQRWYERALSGWGYCKDAAGCVEAQHHEASLNNAYKARLKTGEPRKRKKPGYRVTNARAYNQSVRSLVEAQISRIKRCIGERLLTQGLASQEGEGVIIANLLNRWNAFGKSVCVKNA